MSKTSKMSEAEKRYLKTHNCREQSDIHWPVHDAQGIYLFRACAACEEVKREGYRPEIFSGYDQSDVDEPIEPEPCYYDSWERW